MPRQTSKILQNVKNTKKGLGGFGQKMTTYELNFEDLRSKYMTILSEYQQAKDQTTELQSLLHEKQDRYIQREQEYKEVIKKMQQDIKDHSTRPLEIIEEKTEDEYLLMGIDIHDKEQSK